MPYKQIESNFGKIFEKCLRRISFLVIVHAFHQNAFSKSGIFQGF